MNQAAQLSRRALWLVSLCLLPGTLIAQRDVYVGALGGLATLSGDGRAVVTSTSASTSLYDPDTGAAASLFGGIHLFNYVSVQGNYIWNRNDLTLVSSLSDPAAFSFYQAPASCTQNAFVGDVLVYFRERGSRVRPYVSQGVGFVHIGVRPHGNTLYRGILSLPGASTSTSLMSRTAVGMDVRLRPGWFFRYTFGENISRNAISAQLSPSGQRLLKNFQNFWGIYKTF